MRRGKPLQATLTVQPTARAVRGARELTAHLCAAGDVDEDTTATAVLLTSELVTNAVIHGRSEARLSVTVTARVVRVEVGDDNSRSPVVQRNDEDALDGRGLGLLDAAASDWGVRKQPLGKIVWFELRR